MNAFGKLIGLNSCELFVLVDKLEGTLAFTLREYTSQKTTHSYFFPLSVAPEILSFCKNEDKRVTHFQTTDRNYVTIQKSGQFANKKTRFTKDTMIMSRGHLERLRTAIVHTVKQVEIAEFREVSE